MAVTVSLGSAYPVRMPSHRWFGQPRPLTRQSERGQYVDRGLNEIQFRGFRKGQGELPGESMKRVTIDVGKLGFGGMAGSAGLHPIVPETGGCVCVPGQTLTDAIPGPF